MSKILGIDQSFTNSGIVLLDDVNDEVLHAECFSTTPDEDIFSRAWKISEHIVKLVSQLNPDMIAIEGLAFGTRGSATRDLGGLQFLIVSKLQCQHNRKVEIISPRTVKKNACGKGGATKSDVINSLPQNIQNYFKTLGYKKTKGLADLADAFWIAKSYSLNTKP